MPEEEKKEIPPVKVEITNKEEKEKTVYDSQDSDEYNTLKVTKEEMEDEELDF